MITTAAERRAYATAMTAAAQGGVEYVGFSLLSSGIFRGPRSLSQVLGVGLEAVSEGAYPGLREVHLTAWDQEAQTTLRQLLIRLQRRR